jgi:hypothetical protein
MSLSNPPYLSSVTFSVVGRLSRRVVIIYLIIVSLTSLIELWTKLNNPPPYATGRTPDIVSLYYLVCHPYRIYTICFFLQMILGYERDPLHHNAQLVFLGEIYDLHLSALAIVRKE